MTLSDVSFGDFHGSDTEVQKMNVDAKGEFRAAFWLKEPGLVYLKKGNNTQYFMVSPKEKIYKVNLSCTNNALNPLQIDHSPENKAYQDFINLRKKCNSDLENYRSKNLDDTAIFQEFSNQWSEYQKNSAMLVKKNPQTYVAKTLVTADRINEKDLSSIQSLRQNFLKRVAFADQKFYNTPLPTFLLENYINIISDKNDHSFTAFEALLNTASKNSVAAKRLQDLLFEAISKSKRQDLMNGYIYWAMAHPDKMMHEVVKTKLEILSKSMVDAPFINISLKDTIGNKRELKDAVTSSKYTLLVIYNPDCSHCIETLPKLIPIWEKHQSKGLKIYTVAAKSENALWTNFIKKHTGTGWINVIEDETNSSFGKYSITSLPSFVLINTQGKIVSRMVAGTVVEELQKWLDSH